MTKQTGRILTAVLTLAPGVVYAQAPSTYPTKPVRFIVPQAPGGASDVLSRIIAMKLTEQWPHQVIVDNRVGAGGNIGTELTARAAPDGYTWVLGFVGTHAINPSLYIIANEVQLAFGSMPSVIGQIRGGLIKPLAVTTAKRVDALKDVPTMIESGFPGFDVAPWFGIMTTAGTPPAVVKKINTDINQQA